jgi:hypothetical protein
MPIALFQAPFRTPIEVARIAPSFTTDAKIKSP